jgi:hypothetical protein
VPTTGAGNFTQLAIPSESTTAESLIPVEPDLPFDIGESFWEPDFFQFLLNTEPPNPSFLAPITSSLEPKTLLPANLSIPDTITLQAIENFFNFDRNTHYIPFIHKGRFMDEFIEGRASSALTYAILAFVAAEAREAVTLVEKARDVIDGNIRGFNDLYRTAQALILLVVLQCIGPQSL